jgi:hypothetical protein
MNRKNLIDESKKSKANSPKRPIASLQTTTPPPKNLIEIYTKTRESTHYVQNIHKTSQQHLPDPPITATNTPSPTLPKNPKRGSADSDKILNIALLA